MSRSANPGPAFSTASPASFLPQMLHMSPHLAAFKSTVKSAHPPKHSDTMTASSQQHIEIPSALAADQSKAEHHGQLTSPQAGNTRSQATAEDVTADEQQSGFQAAQLASQSLQSTAEEEQIGQQVLPAVAQNSLADDQLAGLPAPIAAAPAAIQRLTSATADKLQKSQSPRPSLAVLRHPEEGSGTAANTAEAANGNAAAVCSGMAEQLVSKQPRQPSQVQLLSGSAQLIPSMPIAQHSQQAHQAEAQVAEKPIRRSRRMTRSAARASLAASSGSEGSGQTGKGQGNSKRQHAKSSMQLAAIPEAAESALADTGRSQHLPADAAPLSCHGRGSSTAVLATVREEGDAALTTQAQQAEPASAGQNALPACTGHSSSRKPCWQTAQATNVSCSGDDAASVVEADRCRLGGADSAVSEKQQAQHTGTQHAQQAEAQLAEHVSSACEPASGPSTADNAQSASEQANGADGMQQPQQQEQGKVGRSKRPPKPRQPLEPDFPAASEAEPAVHAGCQAEPAMPASTHAESARWHAEHAVVASTHAKHAVPARADVGHALSDSCQAENPFSAAAHSGATLRLKDNGEAAGQSSDAGMLETAAISVAPTTSAASQQVQ